MDEGNSSPTSGSPNNPNNGGAGNEEQPTAVPQFAMPNEDLCLPLDKVIRMMQQVLPPHAKISKDAGETVQKCASKFISFITSEANKRCKSQKRKVVNVEDLLLTMERFGLNNYVEPLSVFYDRYLQNEANRSIASSGYGSRATPNTYSGMFNSLGMGELYKDGSNASGSGSANAINNFDPLAYLNRDLLLDD